MTTFNIKINDIFLSLYEAKFHKLKIKLMPMKKTLLLSLFMVAIANLAVKADIVERKNARHAAKNIYFEKTGIKQASIEFSKEYTEYLNNTPVYHIFNIGNEGFVVVAAESRVNPLLAYSTTNTYNFEKTIPAHNSWMKNYADQISYVRESNINSTEVISNAWNNYLADFEVFTVNQVIKAVEPLLGNIEWDQGAGWNDSCPYEETSLAGNDHVYAGCVATATGMIMRYHSFPPHGNGSHSYNEDDYGTLSANFGATTYNWSLMPENAPNGYVAQLLFHIGVAVNMDYEYDGSGSYNVDAVQALKDYFYYDNGAEYLLKNDYSNTDWMNMLKTNLDNEMPLLYAGQSAGSGSHSFVCDGYDDSDMFHFNWGYSGDNNGYYELTNLNPGSANYTEMQAAGFDIKPGPIGINDLQNNQNSFAVYPNPAKEIAYIESTQAYCNIEIIDVTGKVVYTQNFQNGVNKHSVSTSNFAQGVYFVKINSSNTITTQKLVIK